MRYQKFQKLTAVQPFYRDSLSLTQFLGLGKTCVLTEVAGEGEPDLAPQKLLLSRQFMHLMRCKKYVNKFCYPCLVPEI